jgi:hypothetical protein
MRATFDDAGNGGWVQPAKPPLGRRRHAWWAVILAIMAFGGGTVTSAVYEALGDQQARGVMDQPSWTSGYMIVLAMLLVTGAVGLWRFLASIEEPEIDPG